MKIDYPVIASNYFDDDRVGILDQSNHIIVGVSSLLTKESAEFLCSRINTHAKLVAALRGIRTRGMADGSACFCKRWPNRTESGHQPYCDQARAVLKELGE